MSYTVSIIGSFKNKDTETFFNDLDARKFRRISRVARIKLEVLNAAVSLSRLGVQGNRKNRHSIRINDPWRICFIWKGKTAHDVEIVDCHKGKNYEKK